MTVPAKPTGDLKKLAVEINRVYAKIADCGRTALEYAAEIGEMLNRAKSLHGKHGEWLAWLARECPGIAETTARLYMRIDRNRDKLAAAKSATVADLTLRGAAKLLSRQPEPATPTQDASPTPASSASTPEGPPLAADANSRGSLGSGPFLDLNRQPNGCGMRPMAARSRSRDEQAG
jgi:hypothetical protein